MALTKLNNKAVANVTSLPVALGDMVLVSSATASSSASIEFTLGNYKEYQFYFVNIHPSTANQSFTMNLSIDSGSNYNVTKTTTTFGAKQDENAGNIGVDYFSGSDIAQGTGFQELGVICGADNDAHTSGVLTLFNPSSTTYVKHFIARTATYRNDIQMIYDWYSAGYANTTSALTNIRFKFASGNIDAGTILMYGIN